jgi:hypothetical protein
VISLVRSPAVSAVIRSAIHCTETGAGNFIWLFFRKIKGNKRLSGKYFYFFLGAFLAGLSLALYHMTGKPLIQSLQVTENVEAL